MDATELMLSFVDRYVDNERRERWRELARKKGAVSKNQNQLERHLGKACKHIGEPTDDLLSEFVQRLGPVWCWDFGSDAPVKLASPQDIAADVNRRRAFLAVSEDPVQALYFNGDTDFWACGGWRT